MSDLLPLAINPWLLYRRNEAVKGKLPFVAMPNFLASQQNEDDDAIVALRVIQREDRQIILAGSAEANALLTCQRCLNVMKISVFVEFEQVLVKHSRQLNSVGENDNAIVCEEELTPAPMVEQELILALPMIAKHDNCQAEYKSGNHEEPDRQHPFANLKDLLN